LGIDARHCISYIFRQTLGQMLSENAQINACKNFGVLINESLGNLQIYGTFTILFRENGRFK
jgi:hypothetical protein